MSWSLENRASSYEEGFTRLELKYGSYWQNVLDGFREYFIDNKGMIHGKFEYYLFFDILEAIAHIDPIKTIDFLLDGQNYTKINAKRAIVLYLQTKDADIGYFMKKFNEDLNFSQKDFFDLLVNYTEYPIVDLNQAKDDNSALANYLFSLELNEIELLEHRVSHTFEKFLSFFHLYDTKTIERNIDNILFVTIRTGVKFFNADNALLLLDYDAKRYKPFIDKRSEDFLEVRKENYSEIINNSENYLNAKREIYCKLVEKLYEIDDSYKESYRKKLENRLTILLKKDPNNKKIYTVLKKLLALEGKENFGKNLDEIVAKSIRLNRHLIQFIEDLFPNDKLRFLFPHFTKSIPDDWRWSSSHHAVSKALVSEDLSEHKELLWEFAQKLDLSEQKDMVKLLIQDELFALKKIKKLLNEKNFKKRQLAYFVLSHLNSDESLKFFYITYQNEQNDKLREFAKSTISRKFYDKEFSLSETKKIIQFAKKREKLEGWEEKLFEEKELPKLYLIDGKKAISSEMLRFLFYRMKFLDMIEPDIEAKMLLNHIDKSRSNEFAKFILEAYMKGGAKAPQKYLMAMAGVLGNGELVDDLIKIFNDVFENKRMKMAQYVVGTLALIGTDKALRFIEWVSRKHKKKNALYEYCIKSLEIAAKELGITMFELSDRIIPNFGFDGLYKTIEIEEEEYRVFVAKDFKLRYIDEDNKIKKTLPKKTDKELKKELQAIQKEIREVNKAQKDRLEQYMVVQREWKFEDWQTFYLFNPVMFIYASTLLWAKLGKEKNIEKLFYVDEDSSLLDIEGDDVELEDDDVITIVHPLYLKEDELKGWNELFYELEIEQPFSQIHREIFTLEESEKNKKELDRYNNTTLNKGTYAIRGFLDKKGYKKEIWDGGSIEFYKDFINLNIRVDLGIHGLIIGYDDDSYVEIGSTVFRYIDGKHNNVIQLKDVPELVFSEVVAELELLFKE